MPLPKALLGNGWTKDTARNMLPLLVWCAENKKKITYGQLDKEIQRRRLGDHANVVVYGHPAGTIGNALLETEQETGKKIPPLNVLVVNAKSGIPGSGCDYYLKTYLDDKPKEELTVEQRKAMSEEIMEEVWQFDDWKSLLSSYGLHPLQGDIPALHSEKLQKRKANKSGWSGEPESESHRLLKEWVAKNPQILKSKISFRAGHTEWLFASADRVDVMFENKEGCLAVEVKSEISNDADLERGIYQCVKYQALLRAELKANGLIPNGIAVLVTVRQLPLQLQELADLLSVKIIKVAPVIMTNTSLQGTRLER